MPAKADPHYVGLDIAKDHLDYCLSDTEEGNVPCTPKGHSELIGKLKRLRSARVVAEASGGYERVIVAELLNAGIEVCIVQPGRVRAMAYAEGLLAKTDRIDARLLRRYGQKMEPRLAAPTDPDATVLRELLEHRRQLLTQYTEVQGRLPLAGRTLGPLLKTQERFLKTQIEKVDETIEQHIDDHPDLGSKSKRLQQVQGVGPILAATLIAYVPELGSIDSSQLSALIGVAPYARDSGLSNAPRHIRAGRAKVRHVLYMAALCASRANPILRAFYQRLLAKGKPHKVCIVAVMRKMVCLLNTLIQNPNFALAS
jgi:transposase